MNIHRSNAPSEAYGSDAAWAAGTQLRGVCWSSVIGGAIAAVTATVILFALGSALGFAAANPWRVHNAAHVAATVTAASIVWMIVMQWISSALGGYFAGRLRGKHAAAHGDEVFFRDTAHGFLAWGVATLLTATLAVWAASSVAGAGLHAASTVAAGAAAGQAAQPSSETAVSDPLSYSVDGLFRSPRGGGSDRDVRGEASRILALSVKNSGISPADRAYLVQLVSARTGLSPIDAARRVDDVTAQASSADAKAKQAADTARKSAATVSLFTFLSMLVGAFIAAVAAALGGKHRDDY